MNTFNENRINDIRVFCDGNGGESIEIGQIMGFLPKNWQSLPVNDLAEHIGEEAKQFIKQSFIEYMAKHEF